MSYHGVVQRRSEAERAGGALTSDVYFVDNVIDRYSYYDSYMYT